MIRRHLAASLLVACLAFAPLSPVYADTASHHKAVEEFLAASNTAEMYKEGFKIGLESQVKQMPAEFKAVVEDFHAKYLSWETMKEDFIKLYMESFTEEEIKEMTAFYLTPTGKKTVTVLPSLLSKGMEIPQQRLAKHKDELVANLSAAKKKMDERKAAEQPAAPKATP